MRWSDGICSFADALDETAEERRDVILGNGFSIAYDPQFDYRNLYDRATLDQRLRAIFERLGTSDFEAVIGWLNDAVSLLPSYGVSPAHLAALTRDVEAVRDALVDALTQSHPQHVYMVDGVELNRAADFLANFSQIFTVCYDVLLYWLKIRLELDDGFRQYVSNTGPLRWEPGIRRQVHWIHGAFHIYEGAYGTFKNRSKGRNLIEQVRRNIADGNLPLIVAEGRSDEKMRHIEEHTYLASCYAALVATESTLFVHGMALQKQDEHILAAVEQGSVRSLYVGIYTPDRDGASHVRMRTHEMPHRRAQWRAARNLEPLPLDVHLYDSSTCNVWR